MTRTFAFPLPSHLLCCAVAAICIFAPCDARAHATPVHSAISAAAYARAANVQAFSFDHGKHYGLMNTALGPIGACIDQLNLPRPNADELKLNKTVMRQLPSRPANLLRLGAILEDVRPFYCNHFYDTTAPDGNRGLHDHSLSEIECTSADNSLHFMHSEYNPYNWIAAHNAFESAFSDPDPQSRARHLARGFITLGGIIHLIQDASQPSHVRNDPHGVFCTDPLPYVSKLECWESTRPGFACAVRAINAQRGPIAAVVHPDKALVSLARRTANNFYSDHTIGEDPQPRTKIEYRPRIGKVIVNPHLHSASFPTGLPIAHIKYEGADQHPVRTFVDASNNDVVLRAQLEYLMPQAVDASAAALNYFFRTRLQIACRAERASDRGKLVIAVKNISDARVAGADAVTLDSPEASLWAVFLEYDGGRREPLPELTAALASPRLGPGGGLVLTGYVPANSVPKVKAIYVLYRGATVDGEHAFAVAEQPVRLALPPGGEVPVQGVEIVFDHFRPQHEITTTVERQINKGDRVVFDYAWHFASDRFSPSLGIGIMDKKRQYTAPAEWSDGRKSSPPDGSASHTYVATRAFVAMLYCGTYYNDGWFECTVRIIRAR